MLQVRILLELCATFLTNLECESRMSTDALIYIHVVGCIGLWALGYYMGTKKKR